LSPLFSHPLLPQDQQVTGQVGQLPPEEAWRLPLLRLEHTVDGVMLLEQRDGLRPTLTLRYRPMSGLPDPILRVARFDVVLEVVRVAAVHPFVLVHGHKDSPTSIAGWAERKSGQVQHAALKVYEVAVSDEILVFVHAHILDAIV
jgi:hypothetical protein